MTQNTETCSNTVPGIAMRFGAIAITITLQAALLFGGAGRLDWSWPWVYIKIRTSADGR